MTEKEEAVFREAISVFGRHIQTVKAMEECAELCQALSKWICGNVNTENIAEEIADVSIMLDQMRMIFRNEDKVQEYRDQKVKRLEEHINERKQYKAQLWKLTV